MLDNPSPSTGGGGGGVYPVGHTYLQGKIVQKNTDIHLSFRYQ